MFDLSTVYRPAAPFRCNESYCEMLPCAALRPFIRCFWGTPMPVQPDVWERRLSVNSLVVPDTCMDIIFNINYTENRIGGAFCALDESAHQAGMQSFSGTTAIFAVRFNVWAVSLFAEDDLRGTKNGCFAAEDYFSYIKRELEPVLFDMPGFAQKVRVTEKLLLERVDISRMNADFMNAFYYIIATSGRERISSAAQFAGISDKQLERLFVRYTGAAPKTLASLVRYQLLWQDMISGRMTGILDAVDKYGYYDQAHLINDFRRHHLLTPSQAMEFAKDTRD